jgi:acetyl-CoA carboxylase carboxyl transferase subunit beta
MTFKKPKNVLEGHGILPKEEFAAVCKACKHPLISDDLDMGYHVCPHCQHHFKINARQRIHMIADTGSFVEFDTELMPQNLLDFPGYDEKLEAARLQSAEKDSVICGECRIGGHEVGLFVMEAKFMMGSMGSVTGEKITRLFERATEKGLPVLGYTVSGGARMQEGILSLMQMAKTSGAVLRHSEAGNLFLCVLTDPTTGGVTASFAMEADIIIAEPGALIGFAGPRVIEQTIRKKLPTGFQRAEFLLEHGFVDSIVARNEQKRYITLLLKMHKKELDHYERL